MGRQFAFEYTTDLCCCWVQAQREAWEEEERRRKFKASTRTLQNIYGTKVDGVCPCCLHWVAWLPTSTLQNMHGPTPAMHKMVLTGPHGLPIACYVTGSRGGDVWTDRV